MNNSQLPDKFYQRDIFGNDICKTERERKEKMTWEKQESNLWLPEKANEELIGEVVAIIDGSFGKQYKIKKEDGKTILTPSHKVLVDRLVEAKIKDKVKLVYLREEPPSIKGQNPTKIYDVFIDK